MVALQKPSRVARWRRVVAACAIGASLGGAPVWAQVTWDANTSTSGPQDGSGTWSTTDANWWNGTTDVVWPNLTTSSAVIGANNGAAGTITASGSLTLNAITFNAPGSGTYTLTGGTLGFGGSSPTITANANATIESAITSGAGLTKSGTGNLTLAGIITNTSGAMSFSRGTVTLTGTLTYTSASTFAIGSANGGTLTIAGGTFSANGGGGARQLVIAGGAGQSGTVAVNSGFFSAVGMLVSEDSGGNGVFTQSGGTTTIGASNLWLTGNSSTLTVSGGSFTTPTMYTNFGGSNSATTINVSGSGSLTATSVQVGTATRNGINFNLNVGDGTGGGVFQANTFSWGGATGTATINFNSGTFVGNATHSLPTQIATVVRSGGANISVASSQTLTMSSPLADGGGGGGLRKLGAGTLSLTGTNTYTGTTSIAAGSLSIGNALALQNTTLDLAASDAGTVSAISQNSTLGGLTGSRNLDMLTRTLSIGNNGASTTYSGTLSNGALTKIGSGTLTLTASNSYTGATTISAGALALSSAGSLVSTGTVAITGSGATFDISGASAGRTIGMLTGTAGSSVALGANSLTVGDATSGTFAGAIGGSGGFTKQGAGTLGLSGSNSYSGGTTINSGTIMLSGAGTLGSGTASLSLGGGALDLGGLSISAGNVSITSAPASGSQIQNGTLTGTAFSVSNTSGVSTISASLAGAGAALSKSGVGTLVLSGSNSFGGGVTLTGGQVQVANASALGTGTFTTNVDVDTAIVFNLPSSGTVANSMTINKPGSNRTYYFQQNQANNLTLSGNITVASGNGNRFSLSGASTGTFTLTGSNTFGADVGTSANMTFRIGGTNAAGTGIWRPDLTTKLVLLDGANFRAGVGNYIASFSMESSGTATISGNVWNRNTANVAIITPAGAQLTFAGTIFAEGGFTTGTFSKTGAGTWVVSNSGNQMTYSILGGTLQVPSFTALGGSTAASYVVLDGGSLRYAGAAASTAREFTLGANGGSLDASGSGSAAFTSTAAVSFTGSGNRTLTLTGTNTGNNSLAMALNDNGADVVSLSKTGAGTWSLSGSNGYSGGTTLSAGRLNVNNASALGGGAGNLVVTGGTLDLGNYAIARSGTISITGGTIQSGTLTNDTVAYDAQAGTVSAALAGAASVTKSTSGTVTLSGANTFGGGVTLSAGQLNINGATALGTGTFTISGGTIDNTSGGAIAVTGNNPQNWNSDVTFIGSNALNLGTGAVTLGADRIVTVTSSTLTVGGAVGGAYALTKAGVGTLVLSASNARTQATTINAGTISLAGLSGTGTQPSASDLANTPITINAGATLLAGGTVAGQNSHLINEDLTLNGGALASNGVSGNNNYNFALGGSGRIIAGGGTTSTISASLGVQGTKEFQVGAGSTLTASGVIGSWEGQSWGTINKTGAGTLALTYNGNNYGGLVLTAGTVAVSSGAWSNTAGPGYRADFQGNATLQWAAGNTTDISASSELRIGDGVTAMLDTGANAVSLATAIVLGTNKTGALTKLGSGTLTISASNAFSGATTISAGVLSITDKTALEGTSGVTIAGGAGLTYTGGAATFGKNVTVTAGSGTGTVTNSGGGLLTLSGTLSKDNSVLRLTGGSFNVTGLITGTTVGTSDLVVDAASVTLSNTNGYNGPTYVYNSGTLSLGINNAIPNSSVVYLGNATTRGTLVTGTFSDTVSQLIFSGSGGTVSLSGDTTDAVQLATAGSLTLGSNANLVLTSPGTSLGLYRLISATSISGTFAGANVTGVPTNYKLLYTGTEIDLQRNADQATTFTLTTGTVTRALVNTTVALSGSITNTSPAGSANLGVSLSSGGVLGVTGLSSGTSSLAPQASTAVAGTIQSGGVTGSRSWSVINTDNSAIQTTSTASGSLTVVAQRVFTTNTSTLALGVVHMGGLGGSLPTLVVTSTGLNDVTANATLGSFTGGPSGLALNLTSGSAAFLGATSPQSATYTLGGTAGTAGSISGTFTSNVAAEFGSISDVTVAVTGQVFSGTATWNVAGGGAWGTGASANWTSAGGVGAAPGTFAGYANTDVAIFAGSQAGPSNILLDGATPSLASLVFSNTSGSYVLDQGSGGSLTLASASGAPTVDVLGLHEIKTAVLGSQGFQKTGAGTLVLSGSSGSFSGGTDLAQGALVIDGFLGGAVSVANGATLAGAGAVGGLVTVAGGGSLAPGNGGPGTLLAGGGLSLADAAILNFQLSATNFTPGGGFNDLATVTGDLTLDGVLNVAAIGGGDFSAVPNYTSWRLFNYSGGTFTYNGLSFGSMPSVGGGDRYFAIDTSTVGQVNLVIVPEPTGLALAGIGAALAAWSVTRSRSRRRRRRSLDR